jgi:hypothetical protein
MQAAWLEMQLETSTARLKTAVAAPLLHRRWRAIGIVFKVDRTSKETVLYRSSRSNFDGDLTRNAFGG